MEDDIEMEDDTEMGPPGTERMTLMDVKSEKDKARLIQAKDEETVGPPEGKIPEKGDNIQKHEDNENYESRSYAYCLGKGQKEMGKLNVSDIKKKKTLSGNTAFHIAARYGINEVVKKIAETDIGLFSVKNSKQDRAYHVAARAGHISTLQTLLAVYAQHFHNKGLSEQRCGKMLTKPNKSGNTIFHEALMHGGQKGSAIFEALSSPVTIIDREGAAKSFSLLERDVYGEEVAFSENVEGETPLYLAVKFGYKSIVERLLKNCKGKPKGKSPFLAAIVKRDSGMLDLLRNKEEWMHVKDDQGWLPIHYAAYFGHLDGVRLLLEKCTSCTLIKEKTYGLFPIHLAAYGGHLKVFKELVRHCPDPCEMVNNKDQNVLHIAAKSGKHNVVSYILQVDELANMINEKDKDENTPLHLAARFFHARVVQTLTWQKKVDLTIVNNRKLTALDVAAEAMQENPTLRQRLTWSALKSAKTPRTPLQSRVNTIQRSTKVPAESKNASHEDESSNESESENESEEDESSNESESENASQEDESSKESESASQSKEASLKGISKYQGPDIERFKDRIDTLILVSTLIVTVTFQASIQFPGGSKDDGEAHLLHRRMFQLYIISITISMYGALIATIILFLARLGEMTLLELALNSAMPLLGITVTTLSVAFLAAVYLIIRKLPGLVIIFLLMSIIFIFMVVTVYILVLLPSPSTMPIVRKMSYYPFLLVVWLDEKMQSDTNH